MVIKVNIKIVILSFLIALLMYPSTISFLIRNGKNSYIAYQLSSNPPREIEVITSNKKKIVFMFDGVWKSVYSEAYELMMQYGYRASVSVIPSLVEEEGFMSYGELAELYLEDWDLLNHSYSHRENMLYHSNELLWDFNRGRRWMENRYIGKNSDLAVIPYGEVNPYLLNLLKKEGYRNIRTSDNIIILNNNQYYYYPVAVMNIVTYTTVEEVENFMKKSFKGYEAVILIFNKVGNGDDGYGMTYSKNKLEEIIKYIWDHREVYEVITYSQLF